MKKIIFVVILTLATFVAIPGKCECIEYCDMHHGDFSLSISGNSNFCQFSFSDKNNYISTPAFGCSLGMMWASTNASRWGVQVDYLYSLRYNSYIGLFFEYDNLQRVPSSKSIFVSPVIDVGCLYGFKERDWRPNFGLGLEMNFYCCRNIAIVFMIKTISGYSFLYENLFLSVSANLGIILHIPSKIR